MKPALIMGVILLPQIDEDSFDQDVCCDQQKIINNNSDQSILSRYDQKCA